MNDLFISSSNCQDMSGTFSEMTQGDVTDFKGIMQSTDTLYYKKKLFNKYCKCC